MSRLSRQPSCSKSVWQGCWSWQNHLSAGCADSQAIPSLLGKAVEADRIISQQAELTAKLFQVCWARLLKLTESSLSRLCWQPSYSKSVGQGCWSWQNHLSAGCADSQAIPSLLGMAFEADRIISQLAVLTAKLFQVCWAWLCTTKLTEVFLSRLCREPSCSKSVG